MMIGVARPEGNARIETPLERKNIATPFLGGLNRLGFFVAKIIYLLGVDGVVSSLLTISVGKH